MITKIIKILKIMLTINYTGLLILLLFSLFLSPLLEGLFFGIIIDILFILTLALSIGVFHSKNKTGIIYFGLIFLSIALKSKLVLPLFGNEQNLVTIVSTLVTAYFLGFAIYLLGKSIVQCKRVTSDTVMGGICIYLLIGVFFSVFYKAIYQINSNAFIISSQEYGSTFDPLYFSFVTLCTVGYGEIIPIAPLAKVLTNLEAVSGVLYPATAIARLMSLYVAQQLKD